jgi:hypothetical protein
MERLRDGFDLPPGSSLAPVLSTPMTVLTQRDVTS